MSIELDKIVAKIGDREVNLGEEVERFSEKIAELCIMKRRQQMGEPIKIDDWMLRLRSPEDVINRMFKKEKIKTLMEGEKEIVEGFLSRVRTLTMMKYIERCKNERTRR